MPAERIYIAGPMTGLPDFNFPAFNAMAAHLRSLGFEVLNPAEHGLPLDLHWSVYMRHALRQLLAADSIFFLKGWTSSRGAKLESMVATALDMTRYHEGSDFT
jgi:hypothetical protein